jgi:hypothetical protein
MDGVLARSNCSPGGGSTISKRPWLGSIVEVKDGRLATEAAIELADITRVSSGQKIWARGGSKEAGLFLSPAAGSPVR